MKTRILLSIFLAVSLSNPSMAWEVEEPINHAKQLKSADLDGLVEVMKVEETGVTRKLQKDNVAYREIRLTFRVLSVFKGKSDELITCEIYREPTSEELTADGMTHNQIRQMLLDSVIGPHINAASVNVGEHLLVYLSSKEVSLAR
ncbi:MAG: hypothetical protein ACI9E1_002215 [Cryomorphaceae bacterium]|jgi:hypothetical protein